MVRLLTQLLALLLIIIGVTTFAEARDVPSSQEQVMLSYKLSNLFHHTNIHMSLLEIAPLLEQISSQIYIQSISKVIVMLQY